MVATWPEESAGRSMISGCFGLDTSDDKISNKRYYQSANASTGAGYAGPFIGPLGVGSGPQSYPWRARKRGGRRWLHQSRGFESRARSEGGCCRHELRLPGPRNLALNI